jgi:thiamine-phosphate pyrophosphorylase
LRVARLYLITDRAVAGPGRLGPILRQALAAIPPGAALVQVRERDLDGADLISLARELVDIARERGCRVMINDRVDVAVAARADGVHLPEAGFTPAEVKRIAPTLAIAASAHRPERVAELARAGVDPVVFGPVWSTPSKAAYGPPQGLDRLTRAASAAGSARLFAVGGIDGPQRARQARTAGAAGVAVIRAVMGAADPGRAAAALYEAMA